MTRAEHLSWCKKRALEYCDQGELQSAFVSMVSDLRKHPDTQGHMAIALGTQLLTNGHLDRGDQMRKFIEGFN